MNKKLTSEIQTNFLVVFCTCPNADTANELSEKIIESRLGACVNNLEKVKSTFFWENKIDNISETLLIIKTTAKNFEKLSKLINKIHPYRCPEIIGLPIVAGNKEYLDWIAKSCEPSSIN